MEDAKGLGRLSSGMSFPSTYEGVISAMEEMYSSKIRPLEKKFLFDQFHSPLLRSSDFRAKPMVLLLGQYSVGKTTFIEYMLEQSYPGERIGPEPTTDRFIAIMKGDTDRNLPGNAVSVAGDKPFHALEKFGTAFLSKFQAAECTASLLDYVTFIDTPGVLSGEKQRIGRAYDFVSVVEWFAERSDLILLLFDAHKLDISDEFKRTIGALKNHTDKVRVVLNKADKVDSQSLMRVYGALMWALGKVVQTPEVMRVYIGSFWDKPYDNLDNEKLFNAESKDLLEDLRTLPKSASTRKVDELVKRTRLVRVHMCLLGYLRKQMPRLWGKEDKKKELCRDLLKVYRDVKRIYNLPAGDFPPLERMKKMLLSHDFTTFPKMEEKQFEAINAILRDDLPLLMSDPSRVTAGTSAPPPMMGDPHTSSTTAAAMMGSNPFDTTQDGWSIAQSERDEFTCLFSKAGPVAGGLLPGSKAKAPLMATGVNPAVLRDIWTLADIDQDGALDLDEFILAMHLCRHVHGGSPVPETLPPHLVPPPKRV